MDIIISIRQNPAGFAVSLSHRGDNAGGFTKGGATYRGLALAELLDVVVSELERRLGDPEQPRLPFDEP
jgi:hypothetical protein